MTEQQEQINRVRQAIANHVALFVAARINQEFHVETLRRYVAEKVGGYIAPGSPDRILRDLRAKGVVNYAVLNRRKSLYIALPVQGQMRLFQ